MVLFVVLLFSVRVLCPLVAEHLPGSLLYMLGFVSSS